MSVATIELTDDALQGVGYHLCSAAIDALPTTVRLGRLRPQVQPQTLMMSTYFDAAMASTTLPASINRRDAAAASIARMYCNDALGCCVISGKGHLFGLLSANDSDSGGIVLATDAEIRSQYSAFCGPGDRGCDIANVLNIIKTKGFVMGGKTYKIDGYVSVDHTNVELTKAVQFVLGASTIGINLPQAWTSAAVWDVTSSRIVGGHDVTPIDYDEKGVYIASWGRIYLITWAAWVKNTWIDEYYAVLAPLWYGADGIASANGINVAALQADLAKLGSGVIPDIAPIPIGPTPDVNVIRLTVPMKAGVNGNIVLGSDLVAGDYDAILLGDGPPPFVVA